MLSSPSGVELARRANDGIDVTLVWRRRSGELSVFVSDARTGIQFELAAGSHNALDVFHHPYAYAAARGVAYDDDGGSSVESPQLRLAA